MAMSTGKSSYPKSYAQAAQYLGSKHDRPLPGRSSELVRMGDQSIAVYYHSTPVVTFFECGAILLDTGGWHSNTTKERFNTCLWHATAKPAYVYQKDFSWYLVGNGQEIDMDRYAIVWPDGSPQAVTSREQAKELIARFASQIAQ